MTDQVDWEGLKALEAKATATPWHAPGLGEVHSTQHYELLLARYPAEWQGSPSEPISETLGEEDAEFISALRNAFPAILAQHERDQRVIAAAERLAITVIHGPADEIDMALAEYDKAKQ